MSNTTKTPKANAKASKTVDAVIQQIDNPNTMDIELALYLSNEWRKEGGTKARLMKKHGGKTQETTKNIESFDADLKAGNVEMTEGELIQYTADLILASSCKRWSQLARKHPHAKAFK
jgi:hypothetical protein